MINRNLIKQESIQLQKSYLEGWQQSLLNFEQICREMGQLRIRKRTRKK